MASGHASHYQQAQSRNGASRTALHQIQTQPTRNNRYSYQETPQEHQAATFQPFSPTSPINEVSTSPHNDYIHSYQQQDSNTAQYPREKDPALHNESTSPYGFRPPQQVHPAYFAPIADNGPHAPIMQVQTSTPISPYHSADPLPAKISENNNDLKPSSNAPGSPKYQTIRHETPHFDAPPQRSTADRTTHVYNPDSLAGPNGAPVEKHLPGQVAHPNSTVDPHWKHGLCEPDAVCCLGLFCPCIVYGKTQYRLSRKAEKKDPTDVLGWEKVNGSCGVMAVACGLQWLLASIQRTRIRKLYKIEGSVGSDCIKGLCCCCCVIAQDEREMRGREELIRRHAGPAATSGVGYVAPQGMSFSAPPR